MVQRRITPCRLFVILARNAPVGLVLRHGPTKWTQIIKWNTATDQFEDGQWFHGTIHDQRCDLSPSGKRWIYFAAKHHLRKVDPLYTSTWTGIGKTPYFTALALWPNHDTIYQGGGLFAAENTLWLNSVETRWSSPQRDQVPRAHFKHTPPAGLKIVPIVLTSGDQLFPRRLVRDGWTLTTPGDVNQDMAVPSGRLTRQRGHLQLGLEFDFQKTLYTLVDEAAPAGDPPLLETQEWADWDQQGRLVLARQGKLLSATQVAGRLVFQEIADFNARHPVRILAPSHARSW